MPANNRATKFLIVVVFDVLAYLLRGIKSLFHQGLVNQVLDEYAFRVFSLDMKGVNQKTSSQPTLKLVLPKLVQHG